MRKLTTSDRQKAVGIIAETFDANPSVNSVIGEGGNRHKKIVRLSDYAFIKALNRNGAFVSSNEKGAALVFRSDVRTFSLKELLFEIRLALSLPVSKVVETLKRESYLKQHRYQGTHYYFWFMGVKKGGGKAAFEIKDFIFDRAQQDELPILLETSVPRNVKAYERYGFKTYHIWEDHKNGVTLHFMKWDPSDQDLPSTD